jgi:BASS family bile acid:Na+ symporter
MLAAGLGHTLGQLFEPLRNVPAVVKALVANFVVVPLLAYLLVHLISLDPPYAIGLMLVACAAGAPLTMNLTQAAGGRVLFAAAFLIVILPKTVVFMPLVVPLLAPGSAASAGAIARPLLLTTLLPLAIGLIVRGLVPHWAQRAQPIVGKVASYSLIALIALTIIVNLDAILGVFGERAILAGLLLIGGAFGTGYLLGGSDRDAQIVLGLGTAQRNYAAAMVVASQTFAAPNVLVMVVVVSTVSMLLIPLARVMRRRTEALAEQAAAGDAARRGTDATP